jgi:hypothetical protein
MEVPLIALIAPICRAATGAVCAGEAGEGGTTDATAGDAPAALIAKDKLAKSVAGEIVFRKIMDRIDLLVSLIRPSINLHALLAPEWLIYKVLPEEELIKNSIKN